MSLYARLPPSRHAPRLFEREISLSDQGSRATPSTDRPSVTGCQEFRPSARFSSLIQGDVRPFVVGRRPFSGRGDVDLDSFDRGLSIEDRACFGAVDPIPFDDPALAVAVDEGDPARTGSPPIDHRDSAQLEPQAVAGKIDRSGRGVIAGGDRPFIGDVEPLFVEQQRRRESNAAVVESDAWPVVISTLFQNSCSTRRKYDT